MAIQVVPDGAVLQLLFGMHGGRTAGEEQRPGAAVSRKSFFCSL
jgi:hypothetical protein